MKFRYACTLTAGACLYLPFNLIAKDDNGTNEEVEVILVKVGRYLQPEQQLIAPVNVIDRDAILLRQAADLGDVLNNVPGLAVSQGPRAEALVPNIRGMGNGRVIIKIDGARQNMAIAHRAQTLLEPTVLERVEILRGPASSLYGSGATGGVILFETISAEGFLQENATIGGQLASGFADNNNSRFANVVLATQQHDIGLVTALTKRDSANIKDGSGEPILLTETDVISGLFKADWQRSPHQKWEFTYLGFIDESPSTATADRLGPEISRSTRQQSASLRHQLSNESDKLAVETVLYWNNLIFDERPVIAGQQRVENSLSTIGVDISNTSKLQWFDKAHTLTYGLEWFRDEQKGLRDGVPAPQFRGSSRNNLGLYIQNRFPLLPQLDWVLGTRYDHISSKAEEAELQADRATKLSLQSGLLWSISAQWQMIASVNEAFRAPTLRELYIAGQHFPGNLYQPNPDLKPETARNYELGLRYSDQGVFRQGDILKARVALYRNDVKDFIQQTVFRADAPAPLTNTTQFTNLANAVVEGVELELEWRYASFAGRIQANHLRGSDRTSGLPLDSIAGDDIGMQFTYLAGQFTWGAQFNYTFAQDKVNRAPKSPSVFQADIFSRWALSDEWAVNFRVDNVFNRFYSNHLTSLPQPGRNLKLSASYRF